MTTNPRIYQSDPAPIQPLAAWGTSEAPPKEFLIFKIGPNHATLGGRREVVTLSQKNCNAIVNEWRRRRISGAFDYEHAVTTQKETGVPAAGWFDVEAREDGLWAVRISWTDRALAYFKAKEYRYFSPYFAVNRKGEVTSLYNIALTNWPATDQQRPLIALSAMAWATRRYTMEPLSLEQLQAKAQELMDNFGAKGDLIEIAKWLDNLMRGGASSPTPEGEPSVDGAEMSAEVSPEEMAIAQAARRFTGFQSVKEIQGAFAAYSIVKNERDAATAELRKIKHSAEVQQAIEAKKLIPAKREEALKMDPDFFKAFISLASPVVDSEVVTANTKISQKSNAPTVDELANDPKLIAFCQKTNLDVKTYAQQFARFGVPFSE